ncbi:hypothetical protein [Cellulomonas composti]|uniref:Antitoxin n=1 Tax=Cellulomonas composti TaxID=266130 RepID=A0A511JAG8_9CELL|nr:hypothetical protein [Cellulomonas composti]GEL94703.1 hypothetical protein CCO02nite_13610 [Cellulomonas composti]
MADLDGIKRMAKDAMDRGTEVVRSDDVRQSLGRVGKDLVGAGRELVGTAKAAGRAWSQADPRHAEHHDTPDSHDPVI